jgi:hypothetical protein
MANNPTKEQIVDILTDILVDVIGWIEKDEVLPKAHLVFDTHIDGDDLSIFAIEVVKYFGIKPTFDEWYETGSIDEIADLILRHLAQAR